MEQLHFWIAEVCRVAVSVNADDAKFPDDWLFKHRWVSRVIIVLGPPCSHPVGQEQSAKYWARIGKALPLFVSIHYLKLL